MQKIIEVLFQEFYFDYDFDFFFNKNLFDFCKETLNTCVMKLGLIIVISKMIT